MPVALANRPDTLGIVWAGAWSFATSEKPRPVAEGVQCALKYRVDIRFFRFPLDIALRATPILDLIRREPFAAISALGGIG